MKAFAAWIRGMPVLARWVTVAALFAGVAGGIAGLVIGLFAYAPTAPVAAVEIGLPATLAGGVLGLFAGTIAVTVSRIGRPAVTRPRR